MTKKLFFLWLILFHLALTNVRSQSDNYISGAVYHGFVLPHHTEMFGLIDERVNSFDLTWSIQSNGSKAWHSLYDYPVIGLGVFYSGLSNDVVFGKSYAAYAFMDRVYRQQKERQITFRSAVGVAYLTKPFDLEQNNLNFIIGSHGNAFIQFGFFVQKKHSARFTLTNGLSITHASNGSLKKPNLGINILSYKMMLSFRTNTEAAPRKELEFTPFSKHFEYDLFASIAQKQAEINEEYFYIPVLSVDIRRRYLPKNSYGIGFDLFRDFSRDSYLSSQLGITNPEPNDYLYAGTHLSYNFILNNFSVIAQWGFFVYRRAEFYQTVYHRLALNYRFTKYTSVHVGLKTYYAKADFIEWGIGLHL